MGSSTIVRGSLNFGKWEIRHGVAVTGKESSLGGHSCIRKHYRVPACPGRQLAGLGVWLAGAFLPCAARWAEAGRRQTWRVLVGLANIALAAAAFLRWFS